MTNAEREKVAHEMTKRGMWYCGGDDHLAKISGEAWRAWDDCGVFERVGQGHLPDKPMRGLLWLIVAEGIRIGVLP